MKSHTTVRAALSGGLMALMVLAACGKTEVSPAPPDEPAVLQDYIAITEQVADVVAANPTDRAAAGAALDTLYAEHAAEWSKTVARMRELYTADTERDLGDRMPNRHPKLLERLGKASRRLSTHVSGEPYVLHDEKAREVLAKVAINEEYAELIRENWEETGPKDGSK